ncbi:calcium/sodium antiporter [Sunxiuqinia indica]|uniref:calcium/sodium antiporter n=1 Tax=Sunxiuqinia indica TaxID=2692584 RepID=UPI001356C0B8|nr:calcium/sodium antiporter [Sunxiuqinia indica]
MPIILYSLAMLLCFILLARIVDKFFVASLDRISNDLKLSSDAAGATLMAVGSSAPELFVALFSVLKPGDHEAIGIGSIVGSALFNLLAIGGMVALVKKTKLTWQPVLRDILFYFVAVGLLLWGVFDGDFSMWNAVAFLGLYVVYVWAVVKWRKIFPYEDMEFTPEEKPADCNENTKANIVDKALWLVFPKAERYYLVFFVSILLIAGLSWVLVETAIQISVILNIPEAIIALTVLAIGTSVPDMISSLIVARQGRGDMAISNAIGSNIFDILVGLGLPFMIAMLIYGGTIEAKGQNLLASSVILFASLVAFAVLLIFNRWKINWVTGAILLGLYIFYVAREIVLL